jgi:hypothetical protein
MIRIDKVHLKQLFHSIPINEMTFLFDVTAFLASPSSVNGRFDTQTATADYLSHRIGTVQHLAKRRMFLKLDLKISTLPWLRR